MTGELLYDPEGSWLMSVSISMYLARRVFLSVSRSVLAL